MVGISFGGMVLNSVIRNNEIDGMPSYTYPANFNVEDEPQSVRHGTLAAMSGGNLSPNGSQVGVSAYNSVTGNTADYNISFHVKASTSFSGIPTYEANNDPEQVCNECDGVYTDGSYTFLSTDPNP
jgi:hypothetical protein